MGTAQPNTRRHAIEPRERPTAPIAADRQPVKVPYDRTIRRDWSEPGQDGFNLTREISDIRSRPDLIDEGDKAFLRIVETRSIRGPGVWLSPSQQRRLASICRRFLFPAHAATWRKRQAELKAPPPAYLTPESVDEKGEFQLTTFAYRR